MSRILLLLWLLAPLLLAAADAPKKSALDKVTLETYVRHLFVFGPQIKFQIGEPKPSAQLPGFYDVNVHAYTDNASEDYLFQVSKDGQKVIQGSVFDIAQNPFKPELDKLKTAFSPSFGTPGAPVVLVEFSDFQCPFCKDEAQMLRKNLLSAYPTQVRVYYKDFPLEQLHAWARAGAIAGRCIFRQNAGAFWDFHDWIFEHQGEITAENLKNKVLEYAKGKNLDVVQLNRCLDSKATESEVNQSIAEGKALHVNQTPMLFVNGRRIPGRVDWAMLRNIVDYEIEYQKTARNAGEDCGCEVTLPGLGPAKK